MAQNATMSALGITELVLRDAHQSLLATRMRLDDLLPIAPKLDQVGFWSLESWGGATFDACIRFLGEDPWERIRAFKQAMPNTQQQMLLRGQNLLGYRHYADDVVDAFVERAAINGVDVFRVFDAMNDPRNLKRALNAVKRVGKHAQGTLSYTTSPVHTVDTWVDLAKAIEDLGADSIAIKDMAGTLTPYQAFDLIHKLKQQTRLDIQLHSHATSGLAPMTFLKAIEAGVDRVDTAISSMSMTYSHSPTESIVAALENHPRATGLDLTLLQEIAAYFRKLRKKYAKFEGSLKGVDARILIAQVPGGMLTNMENQLREQGAADRMDEVFEEIPKVREDLGYIPLVTPTSQIVGTQAVLNVLTGERYKTISKETQAILKGEYGRAPAPFNQSLQKRVLDGKAAITDRPADLLSPEFAKLQDELESLASEKGFALAESKLDDVLTYALFPQIGLKFLQNRHQPDMFEQAPKGDAEDTFTVSVEGYEYVVKVSEGGDITHLAPVKGAPLSLKGDCTHQETVSSESSKTANHQFNPSTSSSGEPFTAPLAGNIWKLYVRPGQAVSQGDVLLILEAMKMETEIRSPKNCTVTQVLVQDGDKVAVGDTLLYLG